MDVMALDLFSVGTSARTLNATDLELEIQVSVTESHPVIETINNTCAYITKPSSTSFVNNENSEHVETACMVDVNMTRVTPRI